MEVKNKKYMLRALTYLVTHFEPTFTVVELTFKLAKMVPGKWVFGQNN